MHSSFIKEIEATPAAYPNAPAGLSDEAVAIDPSVIWSRLESWVRVRWSPRTVVWLVEGPGDFAPPLQPVTVETVEVWGADDWSSVTAIPSPYGIRLPGAGPYRITATVGSDNPPDATAEAAYTRLAEFLASSPDEFKPGMSSMAVSVGDVSTRISRDPHFVAKAVHSSGAFDLLRSVKRIK